MFKRVWSDMETFREVQFEPGLNIIHADRSKDSDEHASTNGLGKSTLIRIIRFCLGSDFSREKVLDHPNLANVTFGLDFDYNGKPQTITRNTSSASRVCVTKELVLDFSFEAMEEDQDTITISNDDWRLALSSLFVPETQSNSSHTTKSKMGFPQLSPYFIRLGKSAFSSPDQAFDGQRGPDKKLLTSFLLDLNWETQWKVKDLRTAQEKNTKAKQGIKSAEETSGDKSLGELEALRVQLETQIEQQKQQASNFNVREDYRELETQLTSVDAKIHSLVNDNFSDKRLKAFYQESSAELPGEDAARAVELLRSAGVAFREDALKSIAEVTAFHSEVYRNRQQFLAAEVSKLSDEIRKRDETITKLSENKNGLLKILRSSGAIDTLVQLQKGASDLTSQHEVIRAQINERNRFERRGEELTGKIREAKTLLRQDLEERQEMTDEARSLFSKYTKALYESAGRLVIDTASAGYSYKFSIDREGSDGVNQMMVFCFDLMIASLRAKRRKGFPVLVHDSSIFADVDPQQVALALQLAAEMSEKYGFQYITCMNAGSLAGTSFEDFDPDVFIQPFIKLRLTDDGPEGRLLGIALPTRDEGA